MFSMSLLSSCLKLNLHKMGFNLVEKEYRLEINQHCESKAPNYCPFSKEAGVMKAPAAWIHMQGLKLMFYHLKMDASHHLKATWRKENTTSSKSVH